MTTCADTKLAEIRIAGKTLYVPSAEICGRTVVVTDKWIRTATVRDEDVVEGVIVEDPDSFITELRESKLKADVFTFTQRPPEITPKYGISLGMIIGMQYLTTVLRSGGKIYLRRWRRMSGAPLGAGLS